ncbi:MAG: EamA family transporter [Fervidobacterium sp.]
MLVTVWGSYYIANKLALSKYSVVFTGVFIRFVVLITMTIYMVIRKEIDSLFKTKYVFLKLLLIGFFGFLLDYTAFLGFKFSTASKGAILLRSDVIFSNLISVILGEKLSFTDFILTITMLVGVFFVSGIDFSGLSLNLPDMFFLLSAFFISVNAFVIKSIQTHRKNPVSDNVIAFYNNFFTMIFFLIFFARSFKVEEFKFLRSDLPTYGLLIASLGQFFIYVITTEVVGGLEN